MGRKASLIDRGEREAEVPRRQRRRVRAGRVQGPRGDGAGAAPADRGLPDRGARDRVQATSSSTSAASTWPSTRSSSARSTRRATPGLFGDVEIIVHRGAGAYICGEETALLDSLEGRRGQPRPRPPFPPVQGLFDAPTQINNVCTIATVPSIIEMGAAEVREDRRRELARHGDLLDLRATSCGPGNYELELGTPMRELIYDFAGGIADGRELKAVIPGGSSVPALSPDQIDVPLDYDSLRRDRHVLRRRVADRRRRPLLHGAARAPVDEVLHARVVRQVHAVPRGNALDGADPREARGGHAGRTRTSTCSRSVGSRILGKSLCALGDFAVYPVASYVDEVARGVRARTSSAAAARSTASRRSRASSPRATRTRTHATRCTRERAWQPCRRRHALWTNRSQSRHRHVRPRAP